MADRDMCYSAPFHMSWTKILSMLLNVLNKGQSKPN